MGGHHGRTPPVRITMFKGVACPRQYCKGVTLLKDEPDSDIPASVSKKRAKKSTATSSVKHASTSPISCSTLPGKQKRKRPANSTHLAYIKFYATIFQLKTNCSHGEADATTAVYHVQDQRSILYGSFGLDR